MLSSFSPCAECGAPIRGGAGVGLCSACALQAAIDLRAEAADGQKQNLNARHLGDYELLDEIARGGMGIVYRARQKSLGRIVALKILLGGAFAAPEGKERIRIEAAAAGRLQHPHIVAVHEAGELDGQPFYSMDFVDGKTLADIVQDGPLPATRAAKYVAAVAEAVHYAHSQGVLHRDLKPSNVLLDEFDEPHITDFGLARLFTNSDTLSINAGLTHTGQVLGSPAYMAPEQAIGRNNQTGPASDVYSLGAILYELLGGRPPFHGETPQAVIEQVKTVEPVPPHQLNGSVPIDLETICLKSLQKEVSSRYQTAGQMADDLNRFLRGEPVVARPMSRFGKVWRWARRNPTPAGLSLVSIALLVAVAAVAMVGAVRIRHSRDAAEARLADSYLSEARALRIAGEPQHRKAALALVLKAQQLDSSSRLRQGLRREAVASLARSDVRRVVIMNLPRCNDVMLMCFDSVFEQCALWNEPEKAVLVFRINDGKRLRKLAAPRPDEVACFSPDSRFVMLRYKSVVVVCSVENGEQALELGSSEGRGGFSSGAFSPDARFFGRGETGGRFVTYELSAQAPFRAHQIREWGVPRRARIGSVAWSPDGKALALTTDDYFLTVCDAETGRVRWESKQGSSVQWALAWNGALDLIAAHAKPDMVQVFRGTDGTEIQRIHTPNDSSARSAISSDGLRLASSTERFGVRLFETLTGRMLFADTAASWHLHFESSGQRLGTLFQNGRPAWLEWMPSPILESLPAPSSSAENQVLSFSPDGRMLSSLSLDGPILWDVSRRQNTGAIDIPNPVYAVFDIAGRSLWVNNGPSCVEVDLETRAPVKVTSGTGFWGIAASQRLIAVADHKGRAIQLLDSQRRLVRTFAPIMLPAYVQFSPDGRWLACAADRDVFVWDVDALDRPPKQLPGEEPSPRFSPDSQWLLTLGRPPRLWRTGTWEEGPSLPLADDATHVALAAFGPDGRWLAVTQHEKDIRLIDFETRQALAVFEGPGESRIVAVEFSPDGKILAAARGRGEVQLWDLLAVRRELAKLQLDW